MAHKDKRHYKKEISSYDKRVIELLTIQAQAIIIYLISDMYFYDFAVITIKDAYITYCGGETDGSYSKLLLVEACYLSLIASLIISNVSFTAYEELQNKNKYGLIDYSVEGENEIRISSIYTVLLFYINAIAAEEIFNRVDICSVEVDEKWMELLYMQMDSYGIRFIADCLTLSETLEGIELIKSKYGESQIETENIPNPDEVAVTSALLYLIQRIILFYVAYEVYEILSEECEEVNDPTYFEGNALPILGSFFGIIADILALNGFIQIYNRNIDKPVFGR